VNLERIKCKYNQWKHIIGKPLPAFVLTAMGMESVRTHSCHTSLANEKHTTNSQVVRASNTALLQPLAQAISAA
jgi:hypothetical protein